MCKDRYELAEDECIECTRSTCYNCPYEVTDDDDEDQAQA